MPDNVMRKISRTSKIFAGPVDPWSYCSYGASNFLSYRQGLCVYKMMCLTSTCLRCAFNFCELVLNDKHVKYDTSIGIGCPNNSVHILIKSGAQSTD